MPPTWCETLALGTSRSAWGSEPCPETTGAPGDSHFPELCPAPFWGHLILSATAAKGQMQWLSWCLQRAPPWASPVLDRRRKCEERGGAQEATGATPPSPVLAGPPKSTSHFLTCRSVSGMPPRGPGHRHPLGLPITCPDSTDLSRARN